MPADIYDWIAQLKSNQWVLDVGSGAGSFPGAEFSCAWLALDDDPAAFTTAVRYSRVTGRSHQLPVRDGSIDLVICHHALEHLAPLDETLAEMARVLKPGARCYISVPNGYGLCDAVYRLVFLGGGHVNRFRKDELISLVEQRLNVRLVGWQKLYSSFVYLRKLMEFLETPPPDLSGRLLAIGRLPRRASASFSGRSTWARACWTAGCARISPCTGGRSSLKDCRRSRWWNNRATSMSVCTAVPASPRRVPSAPGG